MKRSKLNKTAKKHSIGWYKKKLDYEFSQWIRLKDAVNGIVICVTCKAKAHYKKMQNGHYIARNHLNTRYDEQNCHVQCVGCNMFKNGNMDEYALFLVEKYGDGILEELNRRKHIIKKISLLEYIELIETYKEKIKNLNVKDN